MSVVLDASALMAYLLKEKGHEEVLEAILSGARMSTVNFSEVATRYVLRGADEAQVHALKDRLPFPLEPLGEEVATAAALMASVTRRAGLSLGDRCCLALAKHLAVPALTADRAWTEVADEIGVTVHSIR